MGRSLIGLFIVALLPILTACNDGVGPRLELTELELPPVWRVAPDRIQRARRASFTAPTQPFTVERAQTDALGRTVVARREIDVSDSAATCSQ